MFEVYCLTSPSGGSYIGFTSRGADKRWSQHVREANKGSKLPLHRAIRKYGPESFTRSLLERMTTEVGAKRAEQLWIKELGTFGSDGYNLTAGGEGVIGYIHSPEECARRAEAGRGRKHAPEARAKMSKSRLGNKNCLGREHSPESRAKISASKIGKKHSPESRANMSKSRLGKKHSPETRAKIGESQLGRKHSPETIAQISAAATIREANKKQKRRS